MSKPHNRELQIKPETIASGLSGIEWCHFTDKAISGQQRAVHLFGYLNPLRPFCITIVSMVEMEWIYAQSEGSLRQCPAFDQKTVALIVLSAGCRANPTLSAVCQQHGIALVMTSDSNECVLDYLQSHLPKIIALRSTQHGVFLAVLNVGVLISGESGAGKSEVAMDLVQRGQQLIADDAIEVHRNEQNELIGECPESLKGYIEIRGLGIINIMKMFGPASVLDSYQLQLIIELQDATDSEVRKVDRLSPSLAQREILGIQVPCLTMLVAPGRNLSVLIEAAVRDHLLRMSGVDSGQDFLREHDELMKRTNEL